ncbi:MAG TPA: GNAT family N-acetyltransferase [Anaerolineales bacterium]|nr:GNAT family N-acetyltransferase [Anaerolineales bacterium]
MDQTNPFDNHTRLLALYDRHVRIDQEIPDVRKSVTQDVVRFIRPAPGMNFISYAWLDETTADKVILNQIEYFLKFDQPFTWQMMEHDLPADLGERLIKHGFVGDDDPSAVMLLDLEHCPPELLQPTRLDVRRITTPEGLDDVVKIEEQVLGGNFAWLKQRLAAHLQISDYLSVYVAYADGKPASTAWTYFLPHNPFAGLFGGATLPEQRKKGLYTALVARRVQEAVQRERRFLSVGCSPNSRLIVARHGFEFIGYQYDFEYQR